MITLQRISSADAIHIWNMQKISFEKLLDKYKDYDSSPACETLEKVRMRLSRKGAINYLIIMEGEPIGAIFIIDSENKSSKYLSRLFILPKYQGKGYAQEAIREVEHIHGEHSWQLDTILQEEKLCYLYEKMGYLKNGNVKEINENMSLVYYEKL